MLPTDPTLKLNGKSLTKEQIEIIHERAIISRTISKSNRKNKYKCNNSNSLKESLLILHERKNKKRIDMYVEIMNISTRLAMYYRYFRGWYPYFGKDNMLNPNFDPTKNYWNSKRTKQWHLQICNNSFQNSSPILKNFSLVDINKVPEKYKCIFINE
jgi:hypothetical protein